MDDTDDDIGFLFLLGLAAAVGFLMYKSQCIGDAVQATTCGWASVEEGPTWVPVINQSEAANNIPTNLLARMAYQESHFRQDIIDGTTASPAGALGILQLMPQYFSTVQVPTPFSTADTQAQITQAAQQLSSLYGAFTDWTLAVAAYNAGETTVKKYISGEGELPAETAAYVADVIADVPIQGQLA